MNVSKSKLVAALGRLSHIPKSTQTPVTRCFMLEATGGVLTISAFGLDQHASENLECVGDLPRAIVPASAFTPIVAYGCEEQVFTVGKNSRLHCEVGATIDTPLIVDDWPAIDMEQMKLVAVNSADLAACIKKVMWSASVDKTRQNICGVHVTMKPDRIFAKSFAGVIGSFCDHPAIAGDATFMVHNDFVSSFKHALEMPEAQLSMSNSWLNVWHSTGSYSCKQSEDGFPNTNPITEAERNLVAWILRDQWLDIFKCIQSTRGPKDELSLKTIVEMDAKTCTFSVIPSDGGSDYNRVIDGKFPPTTLRLNALTFVKCLAAFPEGSTIAIMHITQFDSVALELDDLMVMTTQLRPDVLAKEEVVK